MTTNQSTSGNPDESNELAGDGGSSGGHPSETGTEAHQDGPTGLSEVSDTVALGNELTQAYAGFDPSQHATNPDGTPRMKKGGGFARKRGRKPGSETAGTNPAPAQQGTATAQSAPAKMSPKQGAIFCVAATTAICHGVFGDDVWRITDKAEFEEHVGVVKSYFDATGGLDLPPSLMLFATAFSYAAPRLQSPPTVSRLRKMRDWIAARFSRAG